MKRQGDRGAITAVLVMLMAVTLAGAGLVVDGGRAMSARRHASNTAEAAARAAVSIASPMSDLDPVEARRAALDAARRAGVPARDVKVVVDGDVVTVTVVERRRTVFLVLGGVSTMTVHGTGSARLVYSG
jgi:Flp pilus assembly protein TadG